jgi:carboxymethylenebutenolidase
MREFETEVKTDDGMMDVFVCHPEQDGPHPAVILYMDAPGIREELRDMARRIGTAGYTVLLPNMYYRTGREGHYGYDLSRIRDEDDHRAKMFEVMNALTNARVVDDAKGLLAFIDQCDAAAPGGVGCVGYCMSGQFVMSLGAAYADRFDAIASYHGVKIITDQTDSPHLVAEKIKAEVYLGFAPDDPYVPEEQLAAMPGVMRAAGVNHTIEVYPETEHGFVFSERPVYRKAASERHWETMLALFIRRLRA